MGLGGSFATPQPLVACLFPIFIYAAFGVGFHIQWRAAQDACRARRATRGEFVEPEVFGGAIGLFFDVTCWPIYAAANMHLDDTPFATPCTH